MMNGQRGVCCWVRCVCLLKYAVDHPLIGSMRSFFDAYTYRFSAACSESTQKDERENLVHREDFGICYSSSQLHEG